MAKKYTDWGDSKTHTISLAQHNKNVAAKNPPLAQRLKSIPGLLAKYQSNPGLRSKLPDSYLTPEQRASRKRNQFLAGISNPGSTLAGPDLVNAATQITNSDFDPLLANIGTAEGTVKSDAATQGTRSKSYYDTLNSIFGATGAQQGAANTAAVGDAAARGAATQGSIQTAAQQAQARMAQDANVRGAGLQGNAPADLAATTATQGATAAAESQRAQQAAADTGGAQAAFLRGLQGATAQAGGEAQTAITHDASGLLSKLADSRTSLIGQKAGALTDTLLKLRQQEADNLFTKVGLNLDQAKIDAAGQPSVSDQKTAADIAFFKKHGYYPPTGPPKTPSGPSASDQKTQQEIDFFKTHGYYPTTGPPKGKNGNGDGASSKDVTTAQNSIGTVQADAKAAGIPVDAAHRHQLATWLLSAHPEQAQTQTVRNKNGSVSRKVVQVPASKAHDALYTSIALDVLIDGHVSRYNAGRLHSRGLKVEDLGLPSYTDYQKKQGRPSAAGQRPTSGNPGAGQ